MNKHRVEYDQGSREIRKGKRGGEIKGGGEKHELTEEEGKLRKSERKEE